MDAIEALTQRISVPQLSGDSVAQEHIDIMIQAALRAADHGWLHPSRFISVSGDARAALGKVFLESTDNWQSLPEDKQQKLLNAPLRAPLIIVSVLSSHEHPRIPVLEQHLSTAASTQNIINAAWALGLGAIWRTGDVAYNRKVAEKLGLKSNEQIVGFVYVGQRGTVKAIPEQNPADYLTQWQG